MSKHLIIRALYRDESFLSEGTERLQMKFKQFNVDFAVRNLYDMQFNPVLTTDDFTAMRAGNLPADIVREQQFITEAEYLWFIFPIWWTSMPAILKGYIDRIFLSGFAYTMKNDAPVGLLTSKKVIILNSMGMSRKDYEDTGMFNALQLTIDKGIFEFAGMKVLEHKYFTSIMSVKGGDREKYFLELDTLVESFINVTDNLFQGN